MKIFLSILILTINSLSITAQETNIIEGNVINNTETGVWYGVNIPRNVPTKLIYRNNSISSVNSEGYLLQSGDENPSDRDNNLDNQEILGNILSWNGIDNSSIITHGILTGYNINAQVKYNKLINVPYGIIFKSGTDDGKNMTFTSGGCAYNICKNGKFAVRMKGINGVKIYNNTIYNDSEYCRYLVLITSNQDRIIPAPSKGTKIFNNIFYTTTQIPMISIESGSFIDFESDYNVYWCTIGEPIFSVDGINLSWQQWNALGYDLHSKIINPNFSNAQDFIPGIKMDFGINLGTEWETGLSKTAKWIAGISPSTTKQMGNWQVGAVISETEIEPESSDTNSFELFPNPSNGKFQLKINKLVEGEEYLVEIKNIDGKKLLERRIKESKTDWSLIEYSGSIFFITVDGLNIHGTKKIILK